jgi:hypothetical protein
MGSEHGTKVVMGFETGSKQEAGIGSDYHKESQE